MQTLKWLVHSAQNRLVQVVKRLEEFYQLEQKAQISWGFTTVSTKCFSNLVFVLSTCWNLYAVELNYNLVSEPEINQKQFRPGKHWNIISI